MITDEVMRAIKHVAAPRDDDEALERMNEFASHSLHGLIKCVFRDTSQFSRVLSRKGFGTEFLPVMGSSGQKKMEQSAVVTYMVNIRNADGLAYKMLVTAIGPCHMEVTNCMLVSKGEGYDERLESAVEAIS